MNERSSGFVLDLKCLIEAPPERVFRMFADPAELVKWWGPRGFVTPEADLELRVGGGYRLAMQPPDGELFHLSGEFLEIEPDSRLVYTFRWEPPADDDLETVVTLAFDAVGDATEVSLTQGEFATDERLQLHHDGWTESLEKLRDLVAGSFRERYGPWALVAGASDGVGAEMARAFAAEGVNVVLVARRQSLLVEVAESIRQEFGVDARPVAIDLAAADAMPRVIAATSDLEIGLVAYNAGSDPDYEPFLANTADAALSLVQRNCAVPVQMCHHFAGPMVARGRGGIILVGSGAGLVGGPNVAAYAATKAFDLVFGEALWAELHGRGVDVLNLVLAVTDTPALRRLLARRGQLTGPDDQSPIPGAVSAPEVAADAVANIANGPTWFVGEMMQEGSKLLSSLPRNEAVQMMIDVGGGVMGDVDTNDETAN